MTRSWFLWVHAPKKSEKEKQKSSGFTTGGLAGQVSVCECTNDSLRVVETMRGKGDEKKDKKKGAFSPHKQKKERTQKKGTKKEER